MAAQNENNTVMFPSTRSNRSSVDNLSLLAHQQTAAEICELFYGASPPAWQSVERFYDPHATYENPVVTATDKATIGDVHTLARTLAQLDVPKPGAVLCALFRLSAGHRWREGWFRGARMWNEVNEISECESFDGQKRTMVEHTLHILVLPGLHPHVQAGGGGAGGAAAGSASDSVVSLLLADASSVRYMRSHVSLWPPSPLHLTLPIITRLAFNDAGQITHHRDYWDVKDLLGLIPGMTLAQWIGGRVAAQGIRGVVRAGRALFRSPSGAMVESGTGPPPSKSAHFTIVPQ